MSQEVIEITEREIEIIEVVEKGPAGPTGPQANINYTVVSSPQTLSNSQNIAADTSGGTFTLTLPLNPNEGDSIDIFDYSETFDTNPLTIARNGEPIESLAEDLIANVEGAYFTMIYTGSTRGWQILPRYGTSGGGGGGELTTQGDMLYRGAAVNERLPIGTAGQVLKVNSGATAPEWGNAPDSIDDYTVVTTGQTIVNGARIAANTTSGPFTLTLPATPSDGDTVYILDFASTFDTNNLTLGRNGSNIEGLDEDMVCNVEGSSFKMVYTGASSGWQMIPYYGTGVAIGSNATDVLSLSSGQIVADDAGSDKIVFWDDSESKLTYGSVTDVGAAAVSHTHGNLSNDGKIGTTANLPLRTGTNGVVEAGSFGTAAGTFCEGNDARLSDDRDPNLHAASHLPDGADEIFDQSLDKSDDVEFATVGIGDTPTGSERKFHQHGGKFTVESSSGSYGQFQVINPSADEVSFVLASEAVANEDGTITSETAAQTWAFGTGSYGNDPTTFVIGNNEGGSVFHVLPDGKVGLGGGNSNPAEALDVAGNIALRDIDNGPTATLDAQSQLSDNVTLTIPDQSGTIAVVTDIPTTAGDVGAVAAGAITTSGLTQATARILGRTTASTGAVEEIQIGSGLSLSAGELSATGGSGGGEVRSDFVSPYTYTGLADAGTSESAANWTIRRSEYNSAGTYVATLTASAVQWANRLTASYA